MMMAWTRAITAKTKKSSRFGIHVTSREEGTS